MRWALLIAVVGCGGSLGSDSASPANSFGNDSGDDTGASAADAPTLLDVFGAEIDALERHKADHSATVAAAVDLQGAKTAVEAYGAVFAQDDVAIVQTLETMRSCPMPPADTGGKDSSDTGGKDTGGKDSSDTGGKDTSDTGSTDTGEPDHDAEIDLALGILGALRGNVDAYALESTTWVDLPQAQIADSALQALFDDAVIDLRGWHDTWADDGFCEDNDEGGG
jgi:hypothetical protein